MNSAAGPSPQFVFAVAILGFHALWWIGAFGVLRLQRRFGDAASLRKVGSGRLTARFQGAVWILYLAPAIFGLLAGLTLHAGRHFLGVDLLGVGDRFWSYAAALIAPNTVFLFAFFWAQQVNMDKAMTRASGVGSRMRGLRAITPSLLTFGCVGLIPMLAVFHPNPMPFIGGLEIFLVGIVLLARRLKGGLGPASRGSAIELEPCPLRDELERIGISTGCRARRVTIVPLKGARQGRPLPDHATSIRRLLWFRKFSVRDISILVEFTWGLSAGALTAGIASRCVAHEMLHGRPDDRSLWAKARAVALSTWVLLGSVVVLYFSVMALIVSGWGAAFVIPLSCLAFASFIGLVGKMVRKVLMARRWRGRLRRREYLERTFESWRAADPRAGRTEDDFFEAMAAFNQAMNAGCASAKTADLVLGVESYADYLRSADPDRRARLEAAIRRGARQVEELTAPSPPATPAEPAHPTPSAEAAP